MEVTNIMKFSKLFTLFIVLVLMLSLVPSALAQEPVGNWVSGITCQNMDNSNDAIITLHFYQEGSGTSVLDYDDTILAGNSKNYYTPSSPPGIPEPFLGSVMVESSTQLACNINTQTTGTGTTSNPYRIATSSGFSDSETGSVMYVPQLMKSFSGWNSYVAVQNASATSVSVTVSYKDRFGAAVDADESAEIPGYSNHVFYQAANADLPSNFLGAATITGDGNIAVIANFYNAGTTASTSQFHSYDGFATGNDTLLIPRVVRRFYGYNGGISIQNIDTTASAVTIDFTFAGASYTYHSPTIQPGAALFLYTPDLAELAPVDLLPMQQRYGSAVITSDEGVDIIAIVNEDNRGNPADNNGSAVPIERIGQGNSYNAFLDGAQTQTIFYPQITARASGIFSGGFQVGNTTGTATTCTATFNAQAGLTYDFDLAANGSASIYAENVPGIVLPYNSSVTVECGQNVIGISNLAAFPGSGKVGDSFTANNGVNR
jgi:hypothetical protein